MWIAKLSTNHLIPLPHSKLLKNSLKMHKQEHLVLIYFGPNVNKTSRHCELDAFRNSL